LANLAILVLFVSVATHSFALRTTWPPFWQRLSLGLLFGGGAVVLMLFPVEVVPGIYADLRSAFLGLAGFFGGPIAGIAAAILAAIYRTSLGGAGMWPALLVVATVSGIGIAGHYITARRPRLKARYVFILGAWVALAGSIGPLFLPDELRSMVLGTTTFPVALLVFGATVVAGLAMLHERQRREAFEENRVYRTIIEALPDSLNVKDLEGRFVAANPATAELMGARDAAELIGHTDGDFYKDGTAQSFRADEIEAMNIEGPLTLEQQFRRPNGSMVWLSTMKVPVRAGDGKPVALITHNRDITEKRRLEADLTATRTRLSAALEQMADGLAMFNSDGRLVFCNELYGAFFPLTKELRVPGAQLRMILRAAVDRGEQLDIPLEHVEHWIEDVMSSLRRPMEEEVHRYDGHWLHIRSNPMSDGNAMVVVSDITTLKHAQLELREMTQRLQVLATVDGLTGITNRRAFDDQFDRELARTRRARMPISLILVDVDRFKAFNDIYGHPAGDECLKRVAKLLQQVARRSSDIVARYGGEEFVMVLPETDAAGARSIAEAYRRAVHDLAIPHSGSDKTVVTASIGVASYAAEDQARGMVELVARADAALYAAKRDGRDRVIAWQSTSLPLDAAG
jgi:diguanylate cyclase (GGDEF)-like protein/PAS domain S-box-containing protein